MIAGRSADGDMNRMVLVSHMRIAMFGCDVWFDYVPSASNIADLPTRLDDDAYRRLCALGRRVELALPPEWCLACEHRDLCSVLRRGYF